MVSSWAVYNKQNSKPSAIKFTEGLLGQMKKVITRPENKIYLKLITIKKRNAVHFEEGQNNNAGKMDDLGSNSKHEIGLYEVINDGEEVDDEMDNNKEESKMVD